MFTNVHYSVSTRIDAKGGKNGHFWQKMLHIGIIRFI